MKTSYPRFRPAGDTAIIVELGAGIDRSVNQAIMALNAQIVAAGLHGVVETVPTFRSVLVSYDPLVTAGDTLRTAIEELLNAPASDSADSRRRWRMPVCYDGEDFAPDLDEVADRTGLDREDVISRHLSADYHVYMLGTYPGYGFMGDVDPALSLPRRTNPRLRVPAGSVAITGQLTGIYPLDAPGGWNLIGRSPVKLFDAQSNPPALLRPGDQVRLYRIERPEFEDIANAVFDGDWSPVCEDQVPQ